VSYLLDTDVISNLVRRSPSPALLRHLALTEPSKQFMSTITLGELVYGAHRATERTADLLAKIDSVIIANLPVVSFDEAAAHQYGRIRAELERAGTPIGDADTRIAALALSRQLTVVTGNVRHFQRVAGLTVENWLED
jgi:tRNA(fMet)-specific endonuclease VapC